MKRLKSLIKKLHKRNTNLIVVDFDDTIFSRKEQLESDENLVKLR
jgi:predicted HAD superfamily phosphohydrolase YqeG